MIAAVTQATIFENIAKKQNGFQIPRAAGRRTSRTDSDCVTKSCVKREAAKHGRAGASGMGTAGERDPGVGPEVASQVVLLTFSP